MARVSEISVAFVNFLRANRAYSKWFKNTEKSKLLKTEADVCNHFITPVIENAIETQEVDCCTLIEGAFVWSCTKEGHEYWAELRNKWSKVCVL